MKRPTPPSWLTETFHEQAFSWYRHGSETESDLPLRLYDGGAACYLHQFDKLERPCSGDLEAFHFIGRQRVRHYLRHQLADDLGLPVDDAAELIELAEWDSRNSGPACTGHHRRFDSHATPALIVPAESLPAPVLNFIADWGLESDAERRFGIAEVLAA